MGEKRCYSVGEIQHILGICKTTAYNLIKENQFRAILIGGKYVISKKSFDECGQEQIQGEQKPEEKQERQEGQTEQSQTDDLKEAQATVDAIMEKYGYHHR